MSSPKQARTPGTAARGTGTRTRDKGTRGGRPEPQPPAQRRPAAGSGKREGAARPPGQREAGAAPARPDTPSAPFWLRLATLVLSLGGLGVSVWLTIAHYTTASILACSGTGLVDCSLVTTSPESMVFGIFPVAVLGLAFFVFMVAVNSPWGWRAPWPAVRWTRLGSVVIGMLFVLYLIYTEIITLDHICLWCTTVHIITFLLFALVVFSAAAGYGSPRPASR